MIRVYLIGFLYKETGVESNIFLYYNYYYFSQWTRNPLIDVIGIALKSVGPDRRDGFGVFRPFPEAALPPWRGRRASGILRIQNMIRPMEP